jgi:nicotinate-nucleotide adenylyltransferase
MLNMAMTEYFPAYWPVKIDPIEVMNGESIPTYFLLQRLKRREPRSTFWFVMGDDLLEGIEGWEGGSEMMRDTKFIIFDRNGLGSCKLPRQYHKATLESENPYEGVSSTEVRRRVKAGLAFDDLVTPKVHKYILEQGLYL